jgi:hypothetical protein
VTEKEWQELNTLRAYLNDFKVLDLVEAHFYWKNHNKAPGELLAAQLDKLGEILARHERMVRYEVEPERRGW